VILWRYANFLFIDETNERKLERKKTDMKKESKHERR